ncbi:2-desacetyl-2-hydroxyethyl bacteriochlorophyllide A dehydrogenase [Paenibacillus rhizosphaerae]|uniref:2-desacetyl-2-hydroxyethyl bacteriochlorophyllide A dehydrogenase n=1 Tax=Paenibacillus rhizosphaerae TaxID=297318 RepID=A0A839TPB7_9BACL|nr:zinc-dependent alcohol dehydrogenase family protein [Paenibacillus rhizosphaerae]MBB3128542.1 2-desacetyl-2-hydroxyethyl bacteriochlorophyllide A dehydrogenase [Paenibacillus rhizosphaerae]
MPNMMKALVIHAPHRASIEQVPYPAPGPDDITVKVQQCGICGTDFHIFEGEFLSPYPIIPGHEFSGIVHEVGSHVRHLKPGDRVAVDPTLFCGECDYCRTNRFNQCEQWGALGNTTDGSMAEYVRVPARNAFVMPDEMTFLEGAFIEPFACVVHGMNRLQVQAGDRVLLFGAGAMGLQIIQAVAHLGASELVAVDLSPSKLEMAKALGATLVYSAAQADELRKAYPQGFDVVVDVTGVPSVIESAFNYMGRAAKFLQFGVTAKDARVSINPFSVYNNDWTILGSMAINNTFLPAFRWVKEGRIRLAPLVTHTLSLEEVPALLAGQRDPDMLKAQIVMN